MNSKLEELLEEYKRNESYVTSLREGMTAQQLFEQAFIENPEMRKYNLEDNILTRPPLSGYNAPFSTSMINEPLIWIRGERCSVQCPRCWNKAEFPFVTDDGIDSLAFAVARCHNCKAYFYAADGIAGENGRALWTDEKRQESLGKAELRRIKLVFYTIWLVILLVFILLSAWF